MKPRSLWSCLLAFALLTGGNACVVPQGPTGPGSLDEAEATTPEGPRRASISLVRQAESALLRGETTSARGTAERALRVDQSNPYAYYVMARIAVADGDLAAANRDLKQAGHLFHLEGLDNGRWRARLLRVEADIAEARGQMNEAEDLRRQADRAEPLGPRN